MAQRAEMSSLAGKGHRMPESALGATHAGEAVVQVPAAEITVDHFRAS